MTLLQIDYDDDQMTVMNGVNMILYLKGLGYQFVINDEEQDNDLPSLFYSLEKREDEISY